MPHDWARAYLPRAFKLDRKSCPNGIPLLRAGIQRKSPVIQVNDKCAGRLLPSLVAGSSLESALNDKELVFVEESKCKSNAWRRGLSYLLLT